MKITQYDHAVRMVSLRNLEAMCKAQSGWEHTYEVKATARRALLTYSNPDEYGACRQPYTVRLPLVPSGDDANPLVLLYPVSDYGAADEHDREGCFQNVEAAIFNAPKYWRDPKTDEWKAQEEAA